MQPIKITVSSTRAVCSERPDPITTGMVGLRAEFTFSDDWDGLQKTAVCAGSGVAKDVLVVQDAITVPPECLTDPASELKIGVYGVYSSGDLVIPTVYAYCGRLFRGADPSGDTSTDYTLPIWAQLQAMIGDLSNLTTTARDNLVAAINEAAKSGGGGGAAADVRMQVAGGYIQYSTDGGTTWRNLIAVAELIGAPGKSAYDYAEEAGYTGTETEFAARLAAEIPTVDSTLTKIGQAADAAVVGNRLSTLSEEIDTTSESKVSAHNTGADTHSDIRVLIQGLTDRLNALADSDDTTLDQLSEVVAYIKSNKALIDAITTSKVSVADIVNDLVTNVANKPLSAAQGVALKQLIDDLQAMIPETYSLPIATETTLGGVKPVTATEAMTQPVGVDAEGRLMTKPGSGGSGIAVTGATVGQTVKIAAVNDDGVPTAWEAVDLPSGGDEWELLTKNAETGEKEPIIMDAETLRYNFPSLAEFKKILIYINKTYAAQSGLTGNVWFRYQEGYGFIFNPSYVNNYLEIEASLPGMCVLKRIESNNLQMMNTYIGTYTNVQSLVSPYWVMPNTDWAEYYANCNTTITIWGVRR